jgi:hypothetical protein
LTKLPEVLRADVRRHDDDRVAEIHPSAPPIGQPPFVERLQEEVQHARVRLFDLVEENHTARTVLELVGEQAPTLTSDNAPRHPDQLVHRGCVLVLRHVDAHHLLVIAEQGLGDGLGQLGLADTGRTQEQEHAVRPIEAVLEPALQAGFDVFETIGDIAEDHVFGNLRRVRDDLHDIFRPHVPSGIHLRAHGRRIQPPDHFVRQMLVTQARTLTSAVSRSLAGISSAFASARARLHF